MSGGGHIRSGSPDPLPVPPRYKNGYRDDSAPYPEPAHHRSQRRRDNDRGYGYAHNGEVRIWDVACGYHHRILTSHPPCALCQYQLQPRVSRDIPGDHVSRSIAQGGSLEHPNFQFSRCTGRKRAVCVSLQCPLRISLYLICTQDRHQLYRPKQPARWL